MTSETTISNTSTVASLYEAFGRGDIAYIMDHLSNDCKWVGAGEGFLPQGGTYYGQDAVSFFKKMGEFVEFNSFTPAALHEIGTGEVVAFGNMTGTSRATGKSTSSDWVMHWKFNEEGKVTFFQDFHDTAAEYVASQP